MQVRRRKNEDSRPIPHVPGGRTRPREKYGGTAVEVVCADRMVHEYVNSGVPECFGPRPVYSACPTCGKASADLIGTVGKTCGDCQWEAFMGRVHNFEEREEISLSHLIPGAQRYGH